LDLNAYDKSRTFSRLTQTNFGSFEVIAMLFDVGGVSSFRKYGHKICASMEAPGISGWAICNKNSRFHYTGGAS
jgi:hypothetical protein